MIALGEALARRGHLVTLETWSRWRAEVQGAGMQFVATVETRRALVDAQPDVVVHDILTLAPALAAELEGVPAGTLIPHVHPATANGFPAYASGARLPRTAAGRAIWNRVTTRVRRGLEQGRDELNDTRRRVGLEPIDRVHGGISERLCMVATFPQLEYPRAWPPGTHIVGPLAWEPPYHRVAPPPGPEPLLLVAPSTAQDPQHRLLLDSLAGLRDEPVRVLATWNRRPLPRPAPVGPRQRLVEWISYAQTMPGCALVICNAGHGTMARALASGAPVLAVPHAGDMNENAARLDWAGAGLRLPWPLLSPVTLRLAVRQALRTPGLAARAAELARWSAANRGAERASDLVEQLASGASAAAPVLG